MQKLRFGILEDDQRVGNSIKTNLEKTGLVEVVLLETTSKSFLDKINTIELDAVCLDIDLDGDSMTGLDVANYLNLPVIFTTGKTKDYIEGIEQLDGEKASPVEHITKPITPDKLSKKLPKFINQIKSYKKNNSITLNLLGGVKKSVQIDSIVYITSKDEFSNNKTIFFDNAPPEILIDFSFNNMSEIGLSKNIFITTHKQYRVNVNKITSYLPTHKVSVKAVTIANKLENVEITVAENYRKLTEIAFKERLSFS
jgi:DNA-binding response OmpR family regulator